MNQLALNTAKAEAMLKAKLQSKVFNEEQANLLFRARAKDNGTIVEQNALKRFQEYCSKNCISRNVNLCNMMIQENAMEELSKVIAYTSNIARLNLK